MTNLLTVGAQSDVRDMLTRVVDFLKVRSVTALFTSLTSGYAALEDSESAISSLVDAWVAVTATESHGRRRRGLCVLKSRGMAHSDEVADLVMTSTGIEVRPLGTAALAARS